MFLNFRNNFSSFRNKGQRTPPPIKSDFFLGALPPLIAYYVFLRISLYVPEKILLCSWEKPCVFLRNCFMYPKIFQSVPKKFLILFLRQCLRFPDTVLNSSWGCNNSSFCVSKTFLLCSKNNPLVKILLYSWGTYYVSLKWQAHEKL